MQYTTLTEQPYAQTAATPTPATRQEQIAEYDAASVGSYVHWSGWWQSYNQGTVQWANDWTTNKNRLKGRKRLMVVAVPERVTEGGIDCDGGLVLLSVERWTEHNVSGAFEFEGFTIPAVDETHEAYSASVITQTGIRYRRPVTEFITEIVQRQEGERAFDRMIAEQSDERNDW